MAKIVAGACVVFLVILIHCVNCTYLEKSDVKSGKGILEKLVSFNPTWQGQENVGKLESLDNNGKSTRVRRQTYQGQTHLYPNLPSGPPYGQQPYSAYNNQNHNGYNPSNYSYNAPSGPYGQTPRPNQWQPNGQNIYNNPYGSNTQLGHNFSQNGYPISVNGYRPSNFTNYPSGPYGQNSQTNTWQPNGPSNYNTPNGYKPSNFSHNQPGPYGQTTPSTWQNPYNPQRPYNSTVTNPYPGYKPPGTYNNPSGRPPYVQPGQYSNNSYPGYPSHVTTQRPNNFYPSQRPPYYPGTNSSGNSPYYPGINSSGNQHSVIYDDSTKRPGQNPYSTYNTSNWSGNTLNNTRPTYYPQNGQNTQHSSSYPGSPGYGQQNVNNPYNGQRPPYQYPSYGQNSPSSYPGHTSDSATFNLANGYNPSIPDRPPYGSPYGTPNNYQYPNGTSYDPTKVSPHHFNSA